LKFFGVAPPEILDLHFTVGPSSDHRAEFYAGRPTHLGDLARTKKLEISGKAQRESTRRPMSDWEKIRGKVKFSRHQSLVAQTQMHWHTPNAHCRLRVGQHERL